VLIAMKQLASLLPMRSRFKHTSHNHNHDLEHIDDKTTWKECFITASSIGLIPCPVSTIMIVFMISQGFHFEGLLTGLFFAFGMAGTMLIFATVSWFLRSFLIGNKFGLLGKFATVSLPVFGSLLLVLAALIVISPYI
jgi:ABC-type nickel/cobalt efflux system permease component RcnA